MNVGDMFVTTDKYMFAPFLGQEEDGLLEQIWPGTSFLIVKVEELEPHVNDIFTCMRTEDGKLFELYEGTFGFKVMCRARQQ